MRFAVLANQLIPGFDLLDKEEKQAFKNTPSGIKIKEEAKKTEDTNLLTSFLGFVFGTGSNFKKSIFPAIEESEEYKLVQSKIAIKALIEACPYLNQLSVKEISILIHKNYTQKFCNKYLKLREEEKKDSADLETIESQKKQLISKLTLSISNDEELEARLGPKIEGLKKAYVKNLPLARQANFLLLTKYFSDLPIKKIKIIYSREIKAAKNEQRAPDFASIEQSLLSGYLFKKLQQATAKLKWDDLNQFNRHQAQLLAQKILAAHNTMQDIEMDRWIGEYRKNLTKRYYKINGKTEWPEVELDENSRSLSYLLVKNLKSDLRKNAENNSYGRTFSAFMRKMGDAYSFLQYTGVSGQNDNPIYYLLDAYNLYRFSGEVESTRNVLFNLFSPFLAIWQEYKEIAQLEKNFFKKMFRILMPILIVAGVIVLGSFLLSPLGLPELAFLVAFIPLLLVGMALATQYIHVKNWVFQTIRNAWWGGPFETPEFQVVDEKGNLLKRMLSICGTEENALAIRKIYISEIKRCEKLDRNADKDCATEEERDLIEENKKKIGLLYAEWYDIRRGNVGVDYARSIIQRRLAEIIREEYESLKDQFSECDDSELNHFLNEVISDLKLSLVPNKEKKLIQETISEESYEKESEHRDRKTRPVVSLDASCFKKTKAISLNSSETDFSEEEIVQNRRPKYSQTFFNYLYKRQIVVDYDALNEAIERAPSPKPS